MEATTVRFAAAVRALATASRRMGLAVPAFRSPPRVPGADRTLRRGTDGSAVVAVRRRGRPFAAVLADLVEGVVVVNDLAGIDAARARDGLWHAVESAGLGASGPRATAGPSEPGGWAPARAATTGEHQPAAAVGGRPGAPGAHADRVARRPSLRAVPTGRGADRADAA